MGRHSRNPSYGHRITPMGPGHYRLSWVQDRYYPDSRQRHPVGTRRDTDSAGAKRFAKRWGLAVPVEEASR